MNDLDVLSDLLAMESASLLARLAEANAYIDWSDADDAPALRAMFEEQRDNERRLAEALLDLGGVPPPRNAEILSAGAHYLNVRHLLPRLIDEQRRLLAACDGAIRALDDARALGGVQAVRARHAAHLGQLEQMAGEAATPA